VRTNVIRRAFHSAIKSASFQKTGDGWYRETEDSILVANLQRSSFGPQDYVNLGVWLKRLGEASFPREHQGHLRTRATILDPGRQLTWEREVLNLEHPDLSDEMRFAQVLELMNTIAVPFLLACGSLAEVRRLHRDGALEGAAIVLQARALLEDSAP